MRHVTDLNSLFCRTLMARRASDTRGRELDTCASWVTLPTIFIPPFRCALPPQSASLHSRLHRSSNPLKPPIQLEGTYHWQHRSSASLQHQASKSSIYCYFTKHVTGELPASLFALRCLHRHYRRPGISNLDDSSYFESMQSGVMKARAALF